jgi:hypothetical protein
VSTSGCFITTKESMKAEKITSKGLVGFQEFHEFIDILEGIEAQKSVRVPVA